MSRRVLFSGAVLVRPGAATRIDASQFTNITLAGLGIVGLIGEAEAGQPRVVKIFTSDVDVKNHYKRGDLVEAAKIAAEPGNDEIITAGAQVIVCYKINNSAQATLSHDSAKIVFTDKNYGLDGNSITVAVAAGSGSARIVTIETLDDFGLLASETSPELGGSGKFTMQYTGAGTPATVTISVTGDVLTLATTCTGAAADNLTLTSTNYPRLSDLIRAIDAHPNYTATSLIANDLAFNTLDLDAVSAQNILVLYTVNARVFDVADWINTNSQIISATFVKGSTGPVATLTKTSLAGGTRGTSDNTAWSTALTTMGGVRINQLVPLASADATSAQGTYTIASILAAFAAHCKLMSSTQGRNERQGWIGLQMTKTNLISNAQTTNSFDVCIVGQKLSRLKIQTGVVTAMPEWALATALAGLRAGAPLGEPLTWKFVAGSGLTSDASWSESNNGDVQDLTLAGVTVVNDVRGEGLRIDKCVTSFTRLDNDAYTEETIVQIWKTCAYEWRTALEQRYVGRPGTLKQIQSVPGFSATVFEKLRDAGAITDSSDNGVFVKAYRDLTARLVGDVMYVGATISPTPGINFVLGTLVLVPARINA